MVILIGRILKAADRPSNLGNITISFSFSLEKSFLCKDIFRISEREKKKNSKIANPKYLICFLKYLLKKTNF